MISKLMRLYKRSHGLRQICNVCVYIVHSACTIHLLNLPDKNARRDIVHGVKHLEEIAEGWLGARRTLFILALTAQKWDIELPEEAAAVLASVEAKFGKFSSESVSPMLTGNRGVSAVPWDQATRASTNKPQQVQQQSWTQQSASGPQASVSQVVPPAAFFGQSIYAPQSTATFALPPYPATELRPQPYSSAQTAPLSSRPQQVSSKGVVTSGASPSDMFGGVEQLLRDGQDWVFQDQAQLANGFENWEDLGPNGLGQSPINNGGTATVARSGSFAAANAFGQPGNNGMHLRAVPSGGVAGYSNPSNPAPFDTITAYDNEQDWYQ